MQVVAQIVGDAKGRLANLPSSPQEGNKCMRARGAFRAHVIGVNLSIDSDRETNRPTRLVRAGAEFDRADSTPMMTGVNETRDRQEYGAVSTFDRDIQAVFSETGEGRVPMGGRDGLSPAARPAPIARQRPPDPADSCAWLGNTPAYTGLKCSKDCRQLRQ